MARCGRAFFGLFFGTPLGESFKCETAEFFSWGRPEDKSVFLQLGKIHHAHKCNGVYVR